MNESKPFRRGTGSWPALAAAVLFGASFIQTAAARTELLVYTAVEADELSKFKSNFEKDYPDVDIKWVRDSTGIVTAKLLAEKDNPQADIVWGVAATSLVLLANQGYFQPYAPEGVENLKKLYVDPAHNPPLWVGNRAYVAAVCYNTVEGQKKNLPIPTSWEDLTRPVYKGSIVMPNPNSSGTGFLDVSSWMQMWGEEKAWKFMDGLHENIAWYTHSGSKPCKQAAAGEIPIGISFAYRVVQSMGEGAPLKLITPTEGLGWEVEAFGIVKNTKHLDAARKLADWTVTRKAMELAAPGYAAVAMPGIQNPNPDFPKDIEDKMIKNDFAWAAAHRIEILKKWGERYGAKSEPK